MATIHLLLIAEKSGIGSDNGGCYDDNSSLSYREKFDDRAAAPVSAKSIPMPR